MPSSAQLTAAGSAAAEESAAGDAGGAVAPCPLKAGWVEIELLDEAGRPLPDQRYEIVLPDGTRHAGKTDARGVGAVRGFPPSGTCTVSFPDIDDAAWYRKDS